MKILHVIQRYSPAIGGSEVWCKNICDFLSKHDISSKVLTLDMCDLEEFYKPHYNRRNNIMLKRYEISENSKITIKRYKLWKLHSYRPDAVIARILLNKLGFEKIDLGKIFKHSPHSLWMYLNFFKEMKDIDVVHLHTMPYFHNIAGFFAAKMLHKKIVSTPYFHTGHSLYEKNIILNILKKCDAVIALTSYEKKYLIDKGIDPFKIYVTGCSITEDSRGCGYDDFDVFRNTVTSKYGIRENDRNIIFIGRKEPYKGIDLLINALSEIAREKNIYLNLFLVGPDTDEFINKYGIFEGKCIKKLKVINFGVIDSKKKEFLIKMSDLLALPSRFESFGIVFLEAWRCKKPVVGSDGGAISEIIKEAGLISKLGDTADLKDKISRILYNKNLSEELGRRGWDRLCQEYNMDKVGEKVIDVYTKICNSKN
ncbi:MAG: glycosyltransferase family 4 protein [Candidatus Omnitrophota bacterium]